jgi:glycosyltransferase involved in cell wall biosynthesis
MIHPLVSAIMPTADRAEFLEEAVESFARQTWPNRELVIVDDGKIPAAIGQVGKNVRYFRLPPLGLSIGLKRNIACELATGEYIVHFDDDDIYAPDRIEHQVSTLIEAKKTNPRIAVTGYRRLLFETPEGRRYRYSGPPLTAVGVSLLYEKPYWRHSPFECIQIGEDTAFVMKAISRGEIHSEEGDERIIARIHHGNTSPKSPENWEEIK